MNHGYLLGYDLGSSFIKAALIDVETGKLVASASAPENEMEIISPESGWAEQNPEVWWENLKNATALLGKNSSVNLQDVLAIGISYQMHGLVCVDKNLNVLRPAIIWCDSRAVEIGNDAFGSLGEDVCLKHFLNSPGNFTASKLKWVMENEYDLYKRIYKIMLPGDYIAAKLTSEIFTTPSGLSEGILWDYIDEKPADIIMKYYNIPHDLIPDLVPNFHV
ncbi:MAG: FGGY family carbohydrate kinase, partial [candidate division WOR-3 bacterium]